MTRKMWIMTGGNSSVQVWDAGAVKSTYVHKALGCEKCQHLLAWEFPRQGPHLPGNY